METTLEEVFQKKLAEIKKNPRIVARYAIDLVVTSSVTAVVGIAIHTLVPNDTLSKKQKTQLVVATWALGGAAAQRASRWADHESITSTVLYTIVDNFKKTEEKSEETVKTVTEESTTE